MRKKYYIGASSTFHDPSMSIVDQNGEVLFAESTERYLQNKRAFGCPADPSIWSERVLTKYCDLDADFCIATSWSDSYTKSLGKVLALKAALGRLPKGIGQTIFKKIFKMTDANTQWLITENLLSNMQAGGSTERNLRFKYQNDRVSRTSFTHHHTHAALGAFGSGFEDAVCLVVDGFGESGSVSYFSYRDNKIEQLGHNPGWESLGFFYSMITELCGFDPIAGEEWKVMGMAAYGKRSDEFYAILSALFTVKGCQVKFRSEPEHVEQMRRDVLQILEDHGNAFQTRADLAFVGQLLFTEYMLQLLQNLYRLNVSENVVLCGGCALNSSLNGKVLANTGFRHLYVPPAPADDGNSLGAAWLAFQEDHPDFDFKSKKMLSPYLGSTISEQEVEKFIRYSQHKKVRHLPKQVAKETAKLLAEGKLVAWVQGRAEFGPRALGNRSILADPRRADIKDIINDRVKFREEFRPFAPSILADYGERYFENYSEAPYMERTLRFRDEKVDEVPAVVHADNTGRLQTVKKEWNEKYFDLILAFHELTGTPILLNTSLNVMGKPIVHSFQDVQNVFYNSGLDAMVVNDYLIEK